jgi:hypothetical protein
VLTHRHTMRRCRVADDVDMSADDVLAILLYIIAQSVDHHHSEELVVHLDFIARFHFLPVSTTHLGCVATDD